MHSSENRILVVEGDPDVGSLLEHALLSVGYRVDRAGTVSTARSHIESQEYQLVVAGDVLPDGNGVEIADQAKARGMKALIIIRDASRLSQLGGLDRHAYIITPVRPRELIDIITRHIGQASA